MAHAFWVSKIVLGWLLLPCVFILSYVYGFHQPDSAIQPHLSVAFWLSVSMSSLAVLIVNTGRLQVFFFQAYSVTCAGLLLLISIYYVFVLFGIKTWANIITIELIKTYIQQLPRISQALGISLWPALPIGFLLFLFFYWIVRCFHAWVRPHSFTVNISKKLLVGFLMAVTVFSFVQLSGELRAGDAGTHEPLAVTFYSGRHGNVHYATQGVKNDPVWSRLEEEVRRDYIHGDAQQKKNIIIIVPDALRKDHMSVYGYGRDTTPWLRGMAKTGKAILFGNTFSTCAETTCAHASMLGSRHIRSFPDKIFTLQEVLKRNGYRTQMIIGGDHVNFYNIRELYGDIDDYYDGSMAPGYYMNDDQLVLDKTHSLPSWDGRPVFMHYHLLSNHVL